jgi:ADP-heptose:LPS heptosyltransferase
MLPDLALAALSDDPEQSAAATSALFREVIEPMADSFDPALCEPYAEMFAAILERAAPGLDARTLIERYRRIRQPKRFGSSGREVRDVTVLSRVTLGADVAVTSVMLDAAKKRFPGARIHFAGPAKNYELFAGDRRTRHLEIPYRRAARLCERIQAGLALKELLERKSGIVIDPDSRLTQLGLLPVGDENKYFFWESRSYGGEGLEALPDLAARWVTETFGVLDAGAFIAPAAEPPDNPDGLVTVSFGVGDNPDKRIDDEFESAVLRHLAGKGLPVLVDEGAGGEEADRVRSAVASCGSAAVRSTLVPFASFAAAVQSSRLYVGYDSSGQHVAAACGVPAVAVFGGFANERMLARWRPSGRGPVEIVRADRPDVLENTLAAIDRLIQ